MADLQIAAVSLPGNVSTIHPCNGMLSMRSPRLNSPSSSSSSPSGRLVAARAVAESEHRHNGLAVQLASEKKKKLEEGILHSDKFTIRCYEVGANRRASIQTIANLLQEVACNQVLTLGFSTDGFATTLKMRKHHLIWVTVRMHIEMDEYPEWGDAVELQTWFQETRHGSRRDWLVRQASTGRVIGRATSSWVMMNQDTRRFARVTEDIRTDFQRYGLNPPKFAFPEDHSTYQRQAVAALDKAQYHVGSLKPRRADLDMNQHVNNVAYIGWMIESLPVTLENTHELRSVVLEFKRECSNDDTVESMAAPLEQLKLEGGQEAGEDEQQFLHLLRLEEDGREINRGWSRWVKKQ